MPRSTGVRCRHALITLHFAILADGLLRGVIENNDNDDNNLSLRAHINSKQTDDYKSIKKGHYSTDQTNMSCS